MTLANAACQLAAGVYAVSSFITEISLQRRAGECQFKFSGLLSRRIILKIGASLHTETAGLSASYYNVINEHFTWHCRECQHCNISSFEEWSSGGAVLNSEFWGVFFVFFQATLSFGRFSRTASFNVICRMFLYSTPLTSSLSIKEAVREALGNKSAIVSQIIQYIASSV